MAAATWPQPPRDGVTLWHITDSHISNKAGQQYCWQMLDSVASDVAEAKISAIHGRIHTGDIIDGSLPSYPDANAKAWLEANLGGVQDVWCMGNHDFIGPAGGFTNPLRTRADWESVYGRSANNSTRIVGDDGTAVRILSFAPDDFTYDVNTSPASDSWTIPTATLNWLDSELSTHDEPTFIATHYMLQEQGSYGAGEKAQPESSFVQMISDYPHLTGWLSGHAHYGTTDTRMVQSLAIGNREAFPAISGPSSLYYPGSSEKGVAFRSLFISFRDYDRVEVRYRDHGARKWVRGENGSRLYTLNPA